MAMINTTTATPIADLVVSSLVGQVTRRNSPRDSFANFNNFFPLVVNKPQTVDTAIQPNTKIILMYKGCKFAVELLRFLPSAQQSYLSFRDDSSYLTSSLTNYNYFKNDGILTKSESYNTSMAHSQFLMNRKY